ncbi:MAG: hypothetical protein HYU64_13065 [Armatimonadetes bacterium]|nr:hypothetical protein [Armatimonadota bacterium]
MEIITFKFKCKGCGHEFVYETGEVDLVKLPLGEIHCPSCNWSPMDEFEKKESS